MDNLQFRYSYGFVTHFFAWQSPKNVWVGYYQELAHMKTSLITYPELSHNISLNSYMISKEGHCWKRTTKFKYKINNLNFYCNNTIPCGHYLHRIHWYFKNFTHVIFLCADKICHKIALLKRPFKNFNFLSFVYKS